MGPLSASCEAERVGDTTGLIPNRCLAEVAAPLPAEATAQQAAGADPAASEVRLADGAQDRAGT